MEPVPEMRRALDGMTVFPSNPQLATSLQATTDSVKDAIPECAGLSISLVRNDVETLTFVRTNTLTGVLDAVQYLDDGPCETTVRSGEEVRIDDVLTDENWPLFARISAAGGIRSTLSLPLRRGPRIVGSVNAYGDAPHAFTGREEEIADSFGVQVQSMISNADLSVSPRNAPEADAADSPADRAVIDEALAMLVDAHGFAPETVERRLAMAATRARVPLLDVARGVVLSVGL
jgi:GAF domain-containing protein